MEEDDGKKMKMIRNEEKHPDRLSSLSDCVLTHIFSFFDTITAIKISVISKRYRSLWTLSQILDFKIFRPYPYFFNPRYANDIFDPKGLNILSFEAQVNHVLQWREDSSLKMFRLSLHVAAEPEFIRNCMDYAARHNVQHLRIRGYSKRGSVALPGTLLISHSLTNLDLNNADRFSIELPMSLSLPNLKILRLKNFNFSDTNYTGEVFSGCLSLETLILSKCCIRPLDDLKTLSFHCLKLKNLELKYWRSPCISYFERSICVNAPVLDFFKFQGHIANVIFQDGSSCVNKAWFDLRCPNACRAPNVLMKRVSESFIDMIRQLRNVKSLSLSLRTIEVMSATPYFRPCVFENLRFLRFTAEEKCGELNIPFDKIMQITKTTTTDTWVFAGSTEQSKYILKRTEVKHDNCECPVSISSRVLSFLLENSPSGEILSIEMPKV